MNRIPKSGELYRHFKNKLYQVVGVAAHSETGEQLVIYQALYGDFKLYARPLEMFTSEVDREKYPDVSQKYRFEKVERDEPQPEGLKSASQNVSNFVEENAQVQPQAYANEDRNEKTEPVRRNWADKTAEEKLTEFFDTEDLEMRYNILVSLKGELNDLMINNMAVVLDVVIPDGDADTRYEELKRCIRTKQRYENSRLR